LRRRSFETQRHRGTEKYRNLREESGQLRGDIERWRVEKLIYSDTVVKR